jgi:hypothetical protein
MTVEATLQHLQKELADATERMKVLDDMNSALASNAAQISCGMWSGLMNTDEQKSQNMRTGRLRAGVFLKQIGTHPRHMEIMNISSTGLNPRKDFKVSIKSGNGRCGLLTRAWRERMPFSAPIAANKRRFSRFLLSPNGEGEMTIFSSHSMTSIGRGKP